MFGVNRGLPSGGTDAEDIDAAIAPQPFFPPRENAYYCMAFDPASKRDHFGYAVAHNEGGAVVVDKCGEFKPGLFGLRYSDVLPQLWEIARTYGVRTIASDQIDFAGIGASIPTVDGVPEFDMVRVMSGGAAGAEMSDVTRSLLAQRRLILPNQAGLADELKRLGDFLSVGGARDVRAKRGHDDRSRAIMLAVHQAFANPARQPLFCVIPYYDPPTEGDAQRTEEDLRSLKRENYFFSRGRRGLGFLR